MFTVKVRQSIANKKKREDTNEKVVRKEKKTQIDNADRLKLGV